MRDWPPIPDPKYQRAVFLDRDGTINVDTHYPYRINDLVFLPGSLDALKRLGELPVHIIVVANQAGIAKKLFTREDMSKFNRELRLRVEQANGRIDAFYFCPHLEPKDLTLGTQPCQCTKPFPGMLLEASKGYSINLPSSFMIGDKTSDIAAGEQVRCTTILVNTGKAGKEEGALPVKPQFIVENLLAAVDIVEQHVRASIA